MPAPRFGTLRASLLLPLVAFALVACEGGRPGSTGSNPDPEVTPPGAPEFGAPRTRYAMANACWVIRANSNGKYLVRDGAGLAATGEGPAAGEPFFFKPTALGRYLLHDADGNLLNAADFGLGRVPRSEASPGTEFSVRVVGDVTEYPPTPEYHVEPTPEQVALWRNFADPLLQSTDFTLTSVLLGLTLQAFGSEVISFPAELDPALASFSFEPGAGCLEFPEASSDFTGTPFAGTQADGSVLGHVDAHIHISATEFLGRAQHGRPFHPYGVEFALDQCTATHGPNGQLDAVGGLLGGDFDGHATDGWPTFSEWPARDMLTHEALYWKWLERAWAGGLRVIVNDLVDNQTLCELQRNLTSTPDDDCDPMNNAGRQAGTMYAMENYIDAQYGGPGKGFYQIVYSAEEARREIEAGRAAVVLGIEISNLFNCQLTYNPLRTQPFFEETGSGITENSYDCTVEEGQPDSILTQMQRIWDWGVRQVISIHEFDNAFGGNGIFDMVVLNLGNRENSGGLDGAAVALATSFLGDTANYPANLADLLLSLPQTETPTGEFWTTYDCPIEGETEGFTGYLWGNSGGATAPLPLGQSPLGCPGELLTGNAGGALYCYPSSSQCNARWMTPAGLYTYGKMMEFGFIIDFDHMEMGMKTQLLELAEAQSTTYPLVSTHGTFGGTTVDQARRVLAGGGFLYPSNGSSRGFRNDLSETLQIHAELPAGQRPLFGFGYGTDTNGLSAQSGPRGSIEPGDEIVYPFTMYSGGLWDAVPAFADVAPVQFAQPVSRDTQGRVARSWHQDIEGTSHGGMVTDWLHEIAIEGTPDDLRHIFNSAERFLRTWSQTEQSASGIRAEGLLMPQAPILRPSPPEGVIAP